MIIIGLGTGRSGTASLAKFIDAQSDAVCFHEMAPSVVRYAGTPRPISNAIDEFAAIIAGGATSRLTVDLSRRPSVTTYEKLCKMSRVRLIGDVALYYLNYVETIANQNADVRFVCLKRDKEETVQSWMRRTTIISPLSKRLAYHLAHFITREPYHESLNHWMEHDGTKWKKDPVWDKCFPKFQATLKEDAISQYWDYYYDQADALQKKLGNVFRIIPTTDLSDESTQSDLLDFCGIPREQQKLIPAHINRTGGGE